MLPLGQMGEQGHGLPVVVMICLCVPGLCCCVALMRSLMSRARVADLNRMNEENTFDNEESGTNKSRRDGVLSTNRVCGSCTMNEENASDDK